MSVNTPKNKKDPYKHLIQLDFLTKYRELLKVVIEHDYFKDKRLNNLRVTPAGTTSELLKQYGLIFRQDSPSSFSLAYSLDPNDKTPVEDINAPLQFTFWLHIEDMYFLNYTDLPFEFTDTIYYFNNLDKDKFETEGLNLSKQHYVNGDDRLEISSAMFTYEFAYPMENVNVQVINEMNEIVFDETLEGEAYACTVNLTEAAPGKHTLLIDGLEEKTFYLYPSTMKKIFGVVDLFIDKNDISSYKIFSEEGRLVKQRYYVYFKNRAVRWKYVFVENTPEKMHDEHEIQDMNRVRATYKGQLVDFDSPITETTDSGTETIVIYSSQPVPFTETADFKFRLKTKKGRSKIDWLVDLPLASVKTILKPDFVEENAFFSELFVYL